jgi:hypothetical protein
MTTKERVRRGSLALLSDELNSIEALLGDGRAINSDGQWDSDLARLMVRLRFHQARIKHRMALVGALPTDVSALGTAETVGRWHPACISRSTGSADWDSTSAQCRHRRRAGAPAA